MTDSRALLLEFERAQRENVAMDPVREQRLAQFVAQQLIELYLERGETVPVWNRETRHVQWRSPDALGGNLAARKMADAYLSDFDVKELAQTLDRMLRKGFRRGRDGTLARPRIAQQVSRLLARRAPIDDPIQLIRDCWTYAIADELRTLVRRKSNKRAKPAARRTPVARKSDAKSLLRSTNHDERRLLETEAPRDFAFIAAYEYQAGGLARRDLESSANLGLGSGTLRSLLDAVDHRFDEIDRTATQRNPHSTRRRSARLTGLSAHDFAEVLRQFGLDYKASSLPRLAKRKRDACLAVLGRLGRNAGSGRSAKTPDRAATTAQAAVRGGA